MPYAILPPETPPPLKSPLVTGHFHENASYVTWRTGGTSDFLLMLTESGAGRVGSAHGETITEAGSIVLLRPHTPHDYGTAKHANHWSFLWVHFVPRPHWAAWIYPWPDVLPGVCRLVLPEPARQNAQNALLSMHKNAQSGRLRRDDFALCALEEALLWCDSASPSAEPSRSDERVLQAMQFLRENVSRPVSVSETAQASGVSPSRLVHLFRQHTGQSMGQFVENERMNRAKQLLSLTSRTVGVIAGEVGYENPFYFSLRFKKHAGVSPREWRQMRLEEDRRGYTKENKENPNETFIA